MTVNKIVTFFVLIGFASLPVHSGSTGNRDPKNSRDSGDTSQSSDSRGSSESSDSKDDDEHHCMKAVQKKEAVDYLIKALNDIKKLLPTCKCGANGTLSKIDTVDANSGKTTTSLTCSGCTGLHIPVKNSTMCSFGPDVFYPHLNDLCKIVQQPCKGFTVFSCNCPEATTVSSRATSPVTTRITSTLLKTTIKGPPPTVTTNLPTTTKATVPPVTTNVPTTTKATVPPVTANVPTTTIATVPPVTTNVPTTTIATVPPVTTNVPTTTIATVPPVTTNVPTTTIATVPPVTTNVPTTTIATVPPVTTNVPTTTIATPTPVTTQGNVGVTSKAVSGVTLEQLYTFELYTYAL